jgi:hypothetical protein
VNGVHGLRVRLDGPPQPLYLREDLKALLVGHQLVVEALDRFLEDAVDPPLVNYTGGVH